MYKIHMGVPEMKDFWDSLNTTTMLCGLQLVVVLVCIGHFNMRNTKMRYKVQYMPSV